MGTNVIGELLVLRWKCKFLKTRQLQVGTMVTLIGKMSLHLKDGKGKKATFRREITKLLAHRWRPEMKPTEGYDLLNGCPKH